MGLPSGAAQITQSWMDVLFYDLGLVGWNQEDDDGT